MKHSTFTILVAVLLLVAPPFVVGRWDVGFLMLAIASIFGGWELWSVLRRGKTISKLFWAWARENKKKAAFMLVTMEIGWTLVMLHLGFGL